MEDKKVIKKSIFSKIMIKIRGKTHDFVVKKNKYLKSDDYKASKELILEIISLGLLIYLAFLAFVSSNFLIKIIGFGSGVWVFREKLLPIITTLLGSFSLVKTYK